MIPIKRIVMPSGTLAPLKINTLFNVRFEKQPISHQIIISLASLFVKSMFKGASVLPFQFRVHHKSDRNRRFLVYSELISIERALMTSFFTFCDVSVSIGLYEGVTLDTN